MLYELKKNCILVKKKKMQISQYVMLIKLLWACSTFLFGFPTHDHKTWMRIKKCGYGTKHDHEFTLFSSSVISPYTKSLQNMLSIITKLAYFL